MSDAAAIRLEQQRRSAPWKAELDPMYRLRKLPICIADGYGAVVKEGAFTRRVRELLDERPDMTLIIEPPMNARDDITGHPGEVGGPPPAARRTVIPARTERA